MAGMAWFARGARAGWFAGALLATGCNEVEGGSQFPLTGAGAAGTAGSAATAPGALAGSGGAPNAVAGSSAMTTPQAGAMSNAGVGGAAMAGGTGGTPAAGTGVTPTAGTGGGVDAGIDDVPSTGLDASTAPEVAFAEVYAILEAQCAPCHTESAAGGLAMPDATSAYDNLVEVASQECIGTRVVSGNPDVSVLVQALEGTACFERMPVGRAPLADADVQIIRDWIAVGAPND